MLINNNYFMLKKLFVGSILTASLFLTGCGAAQPKVISTFPQNGAQDVDSQTAVIWVKFNKPMMDKSWSWSYKEKDAFPKLNGDPYYSEENTKNNLPVKLEPNREYKIWINTAEFKDFKDTSGNSSEPYELKFKTK